MSTFFTQFKFLFIYILSLSGALYLFYFIALGDPGGLLIDIIVSFIYFIVINPIIVGIFSYVIHDRRQVPTCFSVMMCTVMLVFFTAILATYSYIIHSSISTINEVCKSIFQSFIIALLPSFAFCLVGILTNRAKNKRNESLL